MLFFSPLYILISGSSSHCPTLYCFCMSPVTVLPLTSRSTLPSCETFFCINLFHRQSLTLSLPAHFNSVFFCDQIFEHPHVVLDDRC